MSGIRIPDQYFFGLRGLDLSYIRDFTEYYIELPIPVLLEILERLGIIKEFYGEGEGALVVYESVFELPAGVTGEKLSTRQGGCSRCINI